MPTHEELEGWNVEKQASDAMTASTLAPRPVTPVHAVDAPCGITTTHSVFHVPSKRYLFRANDPRGVPSDLDEEEIALMETTAFGPPVDGRAVEAIRAESSFAEFAAKETEEDRNAALLAARRKDVQRDVRNLARLDAQLEALRLRKKLVSGLKKEVLHGGDVRVVDALVGWEVPRNSLGKIVDGEWKPKVAGGEAMVKSDSGLGAVGEEDDDDEDADADEDGDGEEDEDENQDQNEWEKDDVGNDDREEVSPSVGHPL
ncbi:uncharacterized protein CC84DRAFT_745235 [Paraphaeosphaeria sporulosa]|uniref:Uncharacterized protein n=1 Tax=Paraphaeosphaeria sporulosa TaxID=1460663 RepID=A0A177CH38_9PLEO|nr:uncharacterized protein CC84DRAFT_745235 [Paraphaeosphaeria sporulosa]OAG06100.1 hypothetical protein CC84DRAFT_745235 [Paraphaeosphaeria sporulosa]